MTLNDNVKEIFQRVQQSLTLNEKNVDVKGDEEENMVLDFTHHLLEDDMYRVNTRL